MPYLYALFTAEIRPGDLDILAEPSREQPGRAILQAATLTEPDPERFGFRQAYSRSGGKIGFVLEVLDVPPHYETYQLELPG